MGQEEEDEEAEPAHRPSGRRPRVDPGLDDLRSFTELNKEIRTRPELIGTNNDRGLPRKHTFGNQRNHIFCTDATII